MDLDLGLGTRPGGTGTLDLDLQEQRKMRWVSLATPRFLFPRLAGSRGYLGYVPYTDGRTVLAARFSSEEEREGTSGHRPRPPSSRTRHRSAAQD